ncbi:hypothetical protein GJ744_001205 [Endocarpon pusillum]|uniref:Uncharacterized protein n=1 Tax=Endocarpon pusillum TaxID=364733 RepID=A0A8H7ABV7_9EURO|nr:hypothetical protein GJ744_001205 [Endocarpon pusillum]
MDADEIKACNAQWFAGPTISPPVVGTCQSCGELSYVTLHGGYKCPCCDDDLTTKKNLPQLYHRCHCVLERYGRWLQTLQSGDDEESTTFQ